MTASRPAILTNVKPSLVQNFGLTDFPPVRGSIGGVFRVFLVTIVCLSHRFVVEAGRLTTDAARLAGK